jgi:beta-lactamase class A
MASVYKLPLSVVWADLADRGVVDPRAVLELDPRRRTPGPTGVSILQDPLRVSARDLVRLMLTLSDNAAADSILELVGLDRLNQFVRSLGLDSTHVRHGTRGSQQQLQLDTGTRTFPASLLALAALHRDVLTAEYDPAVASHTSARDMTRLIGLLWTRTVARGDAGRLVRQAMAQQVWRTRLASGFPHDDVTVAGKTGTLGVLRHEVGVVTFPGEHPVAVAVFTRSVRAESRLPAVDQAIGEAARLAVSQLRRPLSRVAEKQLS